MLVFPLGLHSELTSPMVNQRPLARKTPSEARDTFETAQNFFVRDGRLAVLSDFSTSPKPR